MDQDVTNDSLDPIRKTFVISMSAAEAFSRFTRDINSWWPLPTHSLNGTRAEGCAIEGQVGGRIFERDKDGRDHEWGRIVLWEPPKRMVIAWAPEGVLSKPTRVEMTYTPIAAAFTRIVLLHSHWHIADHAWYEDYRREWDEVLAAYVGDRIGAVRRG